MAQVFVQALLKHGTTTALVFCTVHPVSVDALFEAAERVQMRLIAGKVLVGRSAPEALGGTREPADSDTKARIEKWHGKGRAREGITPRFAPTSTPEQLERAGQLKQECPDVYV
ncbi:guanine deaminase, partial [Acinetobacter baumannii]